MAATLVSIEDEDLSFILNFHPDRDRRPTWAELVDVIAEIQDIVEDGLLPE